MKITAVYEKRKEKVQFREINDRECFYSGGVLYMRILKQDLYNYGIKYVNAISIYNAGLTFFNDDEDVYKSTKKMSCE